MSGDSKTTITVKDAMDIVQSEIIKVRKQDCWDDDTCRWIDSQVRQALWKYADAMLKEREK